MAEGQQTRKNPIIFIGILLIIHGLIHLLYAGQSQRIIILSSDMEWPDYSWLFSRFLHYDEIRVVASIACFLATLGFVAGGIGLLLELAWWSTVLLLSAAFSATLFFVFWDGDTARLTNQGAVDFLINIVILIVLLRQ